MSESRGLACGVAGGIARTSSALRWRLVHGLVAAGTLEVWVEPDGASTGTPC
jgi:hypothetical protein